MYGFSKSFTIVLRNCRIIIVKNFFLSTLFWFAIVTLFLSSSFFSQQLPSLTTKNYFCFHNRFIGFAEAATTTLTVLASSNRTVFSSQSGSGFLVSGEVCAGCSLQLGPNFQVTNGNLKLTLTLHAGANVTIVGLNIAASTSPTASSFLKLDLAMHSDACDLSPSPQNDFYFTIKDSAIVGNTMSFTDSFASAINFATFTAPSACTKKPAGSVLNELPHFRINISSSTLTSICTDTVTGCTDGASVVAFRSMSYDTFSMNFVPLVDLAVLGSRLEVSGGGDRMLKIAGIYSYNQPISSVRVENCYIRAERKPGLSYVTVGIWISNPNKIYTSVGPSFSFPSSMKNYAVDLIFNQNTIVVFGRMYVTYNIWLESVDYFSRMWLLNSFTNNTIAGETGGTSISMLNAELRNYIPTSPSKLHDNTTLWKYFRMIPVLDSSSSNTTVEWEPEIIVGSWIVYNMTGFGNSSKLNAPGWFLLNNGNSTNRYGNVTFANITVTQYGGTSTSSVAKINNIILVSEVVQVKNIVALFVDVYEHSVVWFLESQLLVGLILVSNVTLYRLGDCGKSNPFVMSATCRGDTAIVVNNIFSYWYGRFKRRTDIDETSALGFLTLTGVASISWHTGYLESATTTSSSGILFLVMEGTESNTTILIENFTCFGSSVGLAGGVSVAHGYAVGWGLTAPATGGSGNMRRATINNITVKNSIFDLNKFANAFFGTGVIALGGVLAKNIVFDNIWANASNTALSAFPATVGAIENVVLDCSYLGKYGGRITRKSQVAPMSTASVSVQSFYIRRCTETHSFQFPEPTFTGSVVTDSLSLSLTPVPTPSKTKQPTRTASYHPRLVSAALSKAVISTLAAAAPLAAAGALVGGMPSVAMDAGRATTALATISRCSSYQQSVREKTTASDEEIRNQFVEDYLKRTLSFPESPFPSLCFGNPRGSCIRGAVVANCLIVLITLIVATVIGFVKWKMVQKQKKPTFSSSNAGNNNSNSDDDDDLDLFASSTSSHPADDAMNKSNTNTNNSIYNGSRRPSNNNILLEDPLLSPRKSNSSSSKKSSSNNTTPKLKNSNNNHNRPTTKLELPPCLLTAAEKGNHNSEKLRSPRSPSSTTTATTIKRRRESSKDEESLELANFLLTQQKRMTPMTWARYPMFLGSALSVLIAPWAQVAASLVAAANISGSDMFVLGFGSIFLWVILCGFLIKIVYQHIDPLKSAKSEAEEQEMYEDNNNNKNSKRQNSRRESTSPTSPRSPRNTNNNNTNNNNKSKSNRSPTTTSPRNDDDGGGSGSSINFSSVAQRQQRSPWRLEESFLNFGNSSMKNWRHSVGRFLRSKVGRWLFIGDVVWAEGDHQGAKANGRPGTILWQSGSIVNKYRGSYEIERPRELRKTPKGKKLSQGKRGNFEGEIDTRRYRYDDFATRLCPYAFAFSATLSAFSGFVSGLAAVKPATCDGVIISQATVAGIHLFATLLLRPYIVPARNVMSVVADVLLFVGCIIAETNSSLRNSGLGETIVIISTVVSVISGVLSGGRRVLLLMCKGEVTVRAEMWKKLSSSLAQIFGGLSNFGAEASTGFV